MGIGLSAHYFHETTPELPRIYTFVPRNYTKAATDLHFIATELHLNCHEYTPYRHGSTPKLPRIYTLASPFSTIIATDLHRCFPINRGRLKIRFPRTYTCKWGLRTPHCKRFFHETTPQNNDVLPRNYTKSYLVVKVFIV